nr:hypothetical protein [Xanthomonas euroxanthea]
MQGLGEGINVFKGQSVNRGDSGYTYSGSKQSKLDHPTLRSGL